jgi:hypothetical protein
VAWQERSEEEWDEDCEADRGADDGSEWHRRLSAKKGVANNTALRAGLGAFSHEGCRSEEDGTKPPGVLADLYVFMRSLGEGLEVGGRG